MRKHSFLHALALAAVLTVPVAQAALADSSEQQAMHQTSTSNADPAFSNGAGPYDTSAPPFGD
ncbi:MAG: hypothetical protein ACREEA_06350 [Stellaceae bacterium]